MKPRGTKTNITVPTSLLWLLVFGGLGMLTVNLYLMREQLEDHSARLKLVEDTLLQHAGQPAHSRSARYLLELERRVRDIEMREEQ